MTDLPPEFTHKSLYVESDFIRAAREGYNMALEKVTPLYEALQHEVDALRGKIALLEADLAECYRLTGADPDGNQDWRLAPYAVAEVARLRKESDTNEAKVAQLEAAPDTSGDDLLRRFLKETAKPDGGLSEFGPSFVKKGDPAFEFILTADDVRSDEAKQIIDKGFGGIIGMRKEAT